MTKPLVLIVEDDASMRFVLDECLKRVHYRTLLAADGEEAVELFEKHSPDLVLLDLKIPRLSGMEVLKNCRLQNPEALFIVLTGHATIHTAVEAMKEGAYDFISKPFELEILLKTIHEAIEQVSIIKENQAARQQARGSDDDICRTFTSPVFAKVNTMVEGVAASEYTVLIEGESGTGKSLVAEELHRQSQRRDGPFVRVDCASLHPNLLESELFGFEKGSFTGALNSRSGKLERAHGGTLFFDEISTLDLKGQASLLSVMQNKEFERIGGSRPHALDIRIVAASNQNLKQMVKDKQFRHDLYYRINVFSIYMPPLRERQEDIIPLAYFLIHKFSGRDDIELTPRAAIKLKNYEWPGNIRELENAIKYALILTRGTRLIEVAHLPLELNQGYWTFREKNLGLREILEATEKSIIEQVLLENDLNVDKSAQALKMPRRTLYYRMNKLGIDLVVSKT